VSAVHAGGSVLAAVPGIGDRERYEAVTRDSVAPETALCPEHDGLCAYTGREADRCPWCHSTWVAIASLFRRGWVDSRGVWHPYEWAEVHSCESGSAWRGKPEPERQNRTRDAARARARGLLAVSAGQERPCGSAEGKDTRDTSTGVGEAQRRVNAGTRGIVSVECGPCARRFGVMVETIGVAKCSRCGSPVSVLGAPEDYGKRWNDNAGLRAVRAVLASA